MSGFCVSRGKSPHRTLYLTEENDEWLSEQMRRRIDSPEGKELYSHRMGIIEPCFANMEYCKGMNRFTLRTKRKVNAQWLLYCLVHNIGKCAPRMAELCPAA
ncbi:MAG: transposase [Oscillospiraceae bacterium]|nr:transposase [Oscillospiraceae bacterium]